MTNATVLAAALGSALAAALSSVCQHRSARTAPEHSAKRLRLLAYLLTQPAWLAGGLSAGLGLVLHAVALTGGRLALVQPLLVSGLLFALPVSVLLEHRRPRLRESLWATIVVAGLAAFLLAARPSAGHAPVSGRALLTATAACLAVIGGILAAVRAARPAYRAALLGAAGGIGFGIASALLKQSAALAATGVHVMLSDWSPYGTTLIGALAIVLTQLAYRSGPLASSLPAMTIGDPASAVVVGVLAFHERLVDTPLAVAVGIAAFAAMTVGASQVARYTARSAAAETGAEEVKTRSR
jgi:drug/metabolite transporter (DMT)-like permease